MSKEYGDTLSVGEHTIKVVFNDGGEATTKFEVKAKEVNNENSENITNSQTITNPQTGDNITKYFMLSIISVVGIVISVMINNKEKREY